MRRAPHLPSHQLHASSSSSPMTTNLNQIRFRGTDGEECDDFIYAIQTLEIGADPNRVFTPADYGNWRRAEIAMARMTGAALIWSDSLDTDVQSDWRSLRRALMERWPSPTLQTQQPIDAHIPTASVVASVVPIVPAASASAPPTILQPSPRLFPYGDSDTPTFNIKVVSPKASYTGYVSKIFVDSKFGGRCCTLTDEQPEAFECKDPSTTGAYGLHNINSEAGTEWLDLYRTRSDGLCAMLTLVTLASNKQYYSDRMDGGRPNLNTSGQLTYGSRTVDVSGRLTFQNGAWKVMIGKDLDGRLTLYFWSRRVWDDEDDMYAAELYLVRSN